MKSSAAIAQQHQHDMHGQPGAADDRAGPGAHRIAQGGHQRHHEDQRENEDAEAFQLCSASARPGRARTTRKAHIESVS